MELEQRQANHGLTDIALAEELARLDRLDDILTGDEQDVQNGGTVG
jgi:hypothetical protein